MTSWRQQWDMAPVERGPGADGPLRTPTVLEVLASRRDAGSRPLQRQDDHRVALAIEGGGNRAAYSAGMAIGLAEAGLLSCFDDIYGTSGGALNAAWLLTGQGERWLHSWAWPEVAAAGVSDPLRLLRGGSVVDLRVLVEHVYEQVTPMDFEAILASPIGFHPVATWAATGAPVDLAPLVTDRRSLQTALRASACLPLLGGRPVTLGGRTWLDGGLSEPVPYRSAIAGGATHVLILRTRREDQHVLPSRVERMVLAPYFLAFGSGAGRSYRSRPRMHAEDERHLASGLPHLTQVRPPSDAPSVTRLSPNLDSIRDAIEIGRRAVRSLLDTPGPRRASLEADED